MNWQEVLDCPYLDDLPFKIELNEYGSIVMTPASNRRAYQQGEISHFIRLEQPEGVTLTECSVDTRLGVKVADVAWLSNSFHAAHGFETPYLSAPEICVEIVSPSNSIKEMPFKQIDIKRQLYFEAGALEVWICHEDGRMEFYDVTEQLDHTALVPSFPVRID